jgi:hypothetical protein
MAEIRVGDQVFSIPDCTLKGDHLSLLRRSLKNIIDNDRVPYSSTTCPKCNLDVIVQRRPSGISVSLENLPTTFAGQ